jgi:hypothetical protein
LGICLPLLYNTWEWLYINGQKGAREKKEMKRDSIHALILWMHELKIRITCRQYPFLPDIHEFSILIVSQSNAWW